MAPIPNGGPDARIDGQDPKSASPEAEGSSSFQRRRTSARIADKELLVRRRVQLLDEDGGATTKKRAPSSNTRTSASSENANNNNNHQQEQHSLTQIPINLGVAEETSTKPSATTLVAKSDHAKVKETLRLFNKHYLHFVQEEEKRCGKVEAEKKASKASKSKMMEVKEILYPGKRIGHIPGIDVGHQFYSRAEMVVVGFHSHWLNGIDYMGQSYSKGEYSNYTFPLAVAIVLSGMYEDDLDNAEDVVYTGQGGHNLTGDKRQIRDQVLERGNLALKNCVDQGVPVRVVRGHESRSSYCGKVYTYDGLYKVVQYWAEKGISGFTVFKYRLKRLEGQPLLTTNQVQFSYGRVPQSLSEIRGLVCEDITGGQENIPIPATNLVDDPPSHHNYVNEYDLCIWLNVPFYTDEGLSGYTYLKSIKAAKNVKLPPIAGGCNCVGSCVDSKTCSCARLNGLDFPYVHRDGGRLIEAKDVIYECGPKCGCGPACVNRTSQRGLKYRFEVFRTPKKGWAVRSWDFIPSGAPICEYTGILRRTEDVDSISGNDYIFDIDCVQTMKGLGGRERRSHNASVSEINSMDKHEDVSESVPEFCIDAGSSGNIARFINHSCGPNLFVQCVLHSHHDMKLARVMLFAADNIPPLQELTYDYGYALDSVLGPDGKVKQMNCYCGAADCRKRLF
ncbi:histone H3-K9 methyltransferase [Trema orientale]|uniref:Histone H3-K9 methyltransferase n=1 Tax=Trema orientale TaxID=63057 RepID=A0A2P5BP18_TREOI|nr:histone H3-K9 methyltransferase [Trema orientale]